MPNNSIGKAKIRRSVKARTTRVFDILRLVVHRKRREELLMFYKVATHGNKRRADFVKLCKEASKLMMLLELDKHFPHSHQKMLTN